jgi:fructokinase
LYELLDSAAGALTLYDVNLRKDCYTPAIVQDSLRRSGVVKLNDEELKELAIMLDLGGGDIPTRVDRLMDRFDLQTCLVTLGRLGAYAAGRAGEKTYSPAFRVPRVNPTGAGDAFTAGFVSEILSSGDLAAACRLGNALGSLVTGQTGATQPVPRAELARLLRSDDYEAADPSLSGYQSC